MNLHSLIEHYRQLMDETENIRFKKTIKQIISLLEETDQLVLAEKKNVAIQSIIITNQESAESCKSLRIELKKLRRLLMGILLANKVDVP
ncbi:MAG: hypothetical protein GVY19_14145 [Bacteroidetes bacterium]|jgi:hypothetical protein|nr:hypothetical protein [Bacteroidota bacterium]